MAKEILVVPEEYLREVIEIIRAGLKTSANWNQEVAEMLDKWCKAEMEYLNS